jgi:hypothetical protein
MGDQLLTRPPPCFSKQANALVPAASIALGNPHWARMVGYGPFSIRVPIRKADPTVGILIEC